MSFRTLIVAVPVALMSLNAQAAAPDMVGTWSGTTNTTVFGSGEHHPGKEDAKSVRFRNVPISFVIDQQKGQNFSGKVVTAGYQELLAGALSQDGKGGVMADQDGVFNFKMLSKNKMEVCYAHTKPTSIVAACTLTERK
jgi:hypothetical protein